MNNTSDTATSASNINISLVQMGMDVDPAINLQNALARIDRAAELGADIICLPELFRSPYFCQDEKCGRDYTEEVPGEVGDAISQSAAKNRVTIVAGSVYERTPKGKFNTSMVYDSRGELLGTYRKIHIPHDPGFYEQNYFSAGDLGYQIFTTEVRGQSIKLGVLICYDQWFPEASRALALEGAQVIFYPTAIGAVDGIDQTEGSWQNAWKAVQCGHAVANNVVVASINRIGREGKTYFWGGSFICNAFGKVLAEGGNEDEIISAPINLAHNDNVRETWRFFYERRPDTYQAVVKAK